MPDSQPLQIRVVCHQDALAQRVARALAAVGSVTLDASQLPAGHPAVVVTDLAADEWARHPSGAGGRRTVWPQGCGVLGIGDAAWTDLTLPLDCTDRELQLACGAVARIARLRRERDELARVHQEATQLAETDPLTGLANRRAWETRLPGMLARAAQRGDRPWLALVDLDDFKTINDRDGMQHGDRVLTLTAKSLSDALRRSDLVARIGGDEFGVLLTGIPAERVLTVLDRLRAAVTAADHVTASIGYVAARPDTPICELMAAAERAMRAAKRAGGNRIVRGDEASANNPSASGD